MIFHNCTLYNFVLRYKYRIFRENISNNKTEKNA